VFFDVEVGQVKPVEHEDKDKEVDGDKKKGKKGIKSG
jgi:hypothetical protein